MNKFLVFTLLVVFAVVHDLLPLAANSAPFDPGDVIAVTTREDGSTNVWTAADAMDALGMLNRKYWRDMQTESGRREWHGTPTTRIDTNLLIRIWTYPDGFAWTNSWTRPKSDIERKMEEAARRAAALAARTNGLPEGVAKIIAERDAVDHGEPIVVEEKIEGN